MWRLTHRQRVYENGTTSLSAVEAGPILEIHALHPSLSVECDQRAPSHAVAQPLPALEDRDLLWRKNAANWISRVLGVRMAGARELVAILKMDGGNGTLRTS